MNRMASCMDLTTPLGHKMFKSSIDVQNLTQRVALCVRFEQDMLAFSFFFSVLCISMVAMPRGYKLVISRVLGMDGIYCPQPSHLW